MGRPMFGRFQSAQKPRATASTATDDLRLFSLTFIGGFLFMAVYLA
ncbi:hypothetical protein [Sphingomonas sp. LY160]|nr:hypothetical protein [Sphingomonas sp. LY160]MEA1073067.1 hypothetical protein [Sphingomonas sp. LY160]